MQLALNCLRINRPERRDNEISKRNEINNKIKLEMLAFFIASHLLNQVFHSHFFNDLSRVCTNDETNLVG